MTHRTAKLFTNGGSQAVRLPAEFRFEDVDEVFVRRDAATGDVVLSGKAKRGGWREFFKLRDVAAVDDFLLERPLNEPLRKRTR